MEHDLSYTFPTISKFSDIEPFIRNRPEFVKVERDLYDIVTYTHMAPNTFPDFSEEPTTAAILRECRGLVFDKEGDIISRRFHKFFNYGERAELQGVELDLSSCRVTMKHDGSMVSPFPVLRKGGYGFRLMTKGGITDVSLQAERFLSSMEKRQFEAFREFFNACLDLNETPIFEYVAPSNRIVVKYDQPRFILIGIRRNFDGSYWECTGNRNTNAGAEAVNRWINLASGGSFENGLNEVEGLNKTSLQDLYHQIRLMKGIEGFVLRTRAGHRLKFKSEEYVLFHKTKDSMSRECDVATMILTDKIDDLMGLLSPEDHAIVHRYTRSLLQSVDAFVRSVSLERNVWDTRKEFSLNCGEHPLVKSCVFAIWEAPPSEHRERIVKVLLKECNNKKDYENMKDVVAPNLRFV